MSPETGTRERVIGCLLGGALGDAWGGPYEGRQGPVDFRRPTRLSISDDTLLTLVTCESIVERGAVDPEHIASCFVTWFREGTLRGLGSSTLKAIRDLSAGTHWALSGRRGELSAGNGAAMRIAPLAFLLDPERHGDRTTIRDVCRITHHNDEAYLGALAVVSAIRSSLAGNSPARRPFLAAASEFLPDCAVRDRINELLKVQLAPLDIALRFGATGFVVDTVPLALYCAQAITEQPIESVLAQAIQCGGDADTIASIAGQVAGTFVGAKALPADAQNELELGNSPLQIAHQFGEFVTDCTRGGSSLLTNARVSAAPSRDPPGKPPR